MLRRLLTGGVAVCLTATALLAQQPARMIKGTMGVFTADDYPAEAMRNAEQGRTVADLTVGSDGSVKHCRVKSSSGSPSLDATTCTKALTMRFEPARDEDGKAIRAQVTLPVLWKLPVTSSEQLRFTQTNGVPTCTLLRGDRERRMLAGPCRLLFKKLQRSGSPTDVAYVSTVPDQLLVPE